MRAREFTQPHRMAKLAKTGKIVEILRHEDQVKFSDERGWYLINLEPGKRVTPDMKWVPDTTRFIWVREFNRANDAVNEITAVPTVAKSKREHLDVMPNDGRPIPKGQEADYLGDLVADMGRGLQLWSWTERGTVTYYVFDTDTRTSQLGTTGRPYPSNLDSFVVQGVYSGPKNQYRAADLYAFLILDQGLTLVSDNKQSAGGYRVWQELERRYGKTINIHGFDTKTNEPVNVTTQDEPDTHVDRDTVKRAGPQMKKELGTISRDLRFVASAK